MVIIIDAYNFIKHIVGASFVSDREVRSWVDTFKEYARLRNNSVILFFDAGPGLYQIVEYYGKVTVIYSGQMQSADDAIKKWLREEQVQDVLLVTSDRDICSFADSINVASVGSDDFYKIFNHIMEQETYHEQQISQKIHKTAMGGTSDLDALMEQGSRHLVDKEVEKVIEVPFRVRNGKKASKMDKRLLKKIEKI